MDPQWQGMELKGRPGAACSLYKNGQGKNCKFRIWIGVLVRGLT